jgi:hypothetical protein
MFYIPDGGAAQLLLPRPPGARFPSQGGTFADRARALQQSTVIPVTVGGITVQIRPSNHQARALIRRAQAAVDELNRTG